MVDQEIREDVLVWVNGTSLTQYKYRPFKFDLVLLFGNVILYLIVLEMS